MMIINRFTRWFFELQDEAEERELEMTNRILLGVVAAIVLVVVILGFTLVGTYNSLVRLDQDTQAKWGQVQNVYQRRADLVPNLVNTVKGAANFEQQTITAVTQARAQVGQITSGALENIARDPQAFERFQQAQNALSSALSRLLVVTENYPDLKANQNFRDLQAQLEGTENRISVERMRFNESAQAFNTKRESFPTVLIAGFFGDRFRFKPYFQSQPGAERAPEVRF
jgi:LemA protein